MVKGNGLKPESMKSKAKPYSKSDFDSLVKHWGNDEGYFVAYLDYKVLIGKFCNRAFPGKLFDPKFVQKMRLFNKSKELYIWRNSQNVFSGRLRIDEKGKDVDVIDAWQALYGTSCKEEDGVTSLTEERGTNLAIPFSGLDEKSDLPIRIHTRNYITMLGQAGYDDCRFVEFTNKDRKVLGG